jgi:predicted aspartyl protease
MDLRVWQGVLLFAGAGASVASTTVPAIFEAGHVFATPTLADGRTLKLVVDTGGGGANWSLSASTAKTLGLPLSQGCFGGGTSIAAPAFRKGRELPALNPRGCTNVAVFPDDRLSAMTQGLIGGWYLAARTWTFDYPAHRLVLQDASWTPEAGARAESLGFVLDDAGAIGIPFPRITITVAGAPLDMLLDTGATAHPTEDAKTKHGMATAADGFAAGSYVTSSQMDRWHKAHPEWPLAEAADDLLGKATRAIRVPAVGVAGWITGPVWFIERPDKAFGKEGMSGMMDADVLGAAGGNILSSFRMTIDYPHRKAWFTCVTDCKPAAK